MFKFFHPIHPVSNHEKVIFAIAGLSSVIIILWCIAVPLVLLWRDSKDFIAYFQTIPAIFGAIGGPNLAIIALSMGRRYMENKLGIKNDAVPDKPEEGN